MFRYSVAIIAVVITLPACAHDADLDSTKDPAVAEQANAALVLQGSSGLSPVCFWDDNTQMSLRIYGKMSLLDNGVLRAPYMLPKGCADVPEYVVRCALPRGEMVKTASGTVYEGAFGFAPNWVNEKLSSSEQRSITACLLQSLSSVKDVPFGLDESSGAEIPGLSESILAGNLFLGGTAPIGAAAFQASGCVADGLVDMCGGNAEAALKARICGNSAKCGLDLFGSCSEACEFDASGHVVNCFGTDLPGYLEMRVEDAAMASLHGSVCQ